VVALEWSDASGLCTCASDQCTKKLTAIFSLWAINRGGVLAMAEVEHQGDFVSMLKSAWEPSNSLVLVN
jgi:hypothetical protein